MLLLGIRRIWEAFAICPKFVRSKIGPAKFAICRMQNFKNLLRIIVGEGQ